MKVNGRKRKGVETEECGEQMEGIKNERKENGERKKKETGEKLLVKNAEEYTSPISKIYKVKECYIICTENSIYLVSADIPTKHISA